MKKFTKQCSSLEPKDKSPAYVYPCDYNTYVAQRTKIYYEFDRRHYFVVCLPYSTFFFTRAEFAIVEDLIEIVEEYQHQPSREYYEDMQNELWETGATLYYTLQD